MRQQQINEKGDKDENRLPEHVRVRLCMVNASYWASVIIFLKQDFHLSLELLHF